ncbi:S8 family serine peptidase [Archangium violaceum]|uniref:S8 family peptidase n=1 Tax=Archangium violaceum TaxID=83451 RepID=UPI00193B0643|nr:S8 family peptidase [Archangium violaceum]QRK12436.1 S8 family serine peptidase [Archangium violaceum]
MKSSHLAYCRTVALVGVALWASASGAQTRQRASRPLMPRAAVVKHSGRELPPDTLVERLVVKFHEGSRVRLRGNALASLASERSSSERSRFFGRGLTEARLTDDLRSVQSLLERAPRTHGLRRLLQEDEAVLEARQLSGESASGRQLADLNLYFEVPLLPGTTAERVAALVEALNAVESVEVAYAEPPAEPAVVGAGLDTVVSSLLAASDLPPTTPLYESRQGYLDAAPRGIDARYAWTVLGGSGSGVRIVDVESGWNTTHEDMPGFFYIGDAGDKRDHGTAVLGELVGAANGYGVTGIVHSAQVGIESHLSQGLSNALSRAATAAGPGGLLLVEVHRQGPSDGTACTCNTSQCNYVAVEYWQADYDIIAQATANGVIVLEAAGNGSANLDAAAYNNAFNRAVRDSGAILVGASTATTRVPMCWTNFGSRVDVHGWGEQVVSMGYGDLFSSGVDQYYTATFSGTSSASPIATGAAASLQGISLAYGRGALDSRTVRSLLVSTGTPQASDSRKIGPLPDLRQAIAQLFNGTLAVRIDGPSAAGYWCWEGAWTAHPIGGDGNYTYLWQRNDNGTWRDVGSGPSYGQQVCDATDLRVTVTSAGLSASDSIYLWVD